MSNSERFRLLEARLHELRIHMLPEVFSATGEYSEKELDYTRGYKLLAHAEIESFIEDVSTDKIKSAIINWKTNKQPSLTLISFLASYHSSWNIDDSASNEEIIKISKGRIKSDSINKIIDLAHTQYIKRVKDNHGVREKNFLSMVLPIGICEDTIDTNLTSNLDSFGKLRGEIAHKSRRSLTVNINPQDELNTVTNILNGLRDLDLEMQSI